MCQVWLKLAKWLNVPEKKIFKSLQYTFFYFDIISLKKRAMSFHLNKFETTFIQQGHPFAQLSWSKSSGSGEGDECVKSLPQ